MLSNNWASARLSRLTTLLLKFHSWISPVTHFSHLSFLGLDFSLAQNKQRSSHRCEIMSESSHGATKTLQSIWCLFHVSMFGFQVMSPIPKGAQQAGGVRLTIPFSVWLTLIWISWFSSLGLTACGPIKHHAAQWVWILALQGTAGRLKRIWKKLQPQCFSRGNPGLGFTPKQSIPEIFFSFSSRATMPLYERLFLNNMEVWLLRKHSPKVKFWCLM